MIRRFASGAVLETAERRHVAAGRGDGVPAEPASPLDPADATGYRDGYADGFEAGETDARRMTEQRLRELEERANERLEAASRVLAGERDRLAALLEGMTQALQQHDDAMRELAFEVALSSMAGLCGQMKGNGELLRGLCERVADEYRTKATRICVSPDDKALLPERIADLPVEAEPRMADGSCRVVTARGYVESSIGMRLTAIFEAMLETLGEGGA